MELAACFLLRCTKMHIKVGLNDASKTLPRIQELMSTDPGNISVCGLEMTHTVCLGHLHLSRCSPSPWQYREGGLLGCSS